MAVEVTIKQNGPIRDYKLEAFIKDKFKYGVLDNHYRLIIGEHGKNMILYAPDMIGRGIDFRIETDGIFLRLSIPSGSNEINIFYDLIKDVAEMFGAKEFVRNEKTESIEDIIKLKEENINESIEALKEVKADFEKGEVDRYTIFGALNPLVLGKAEIKRIDCDLNNLDAYLHEVQNTDAYFAAPTLYRYGSEIIGVYAVKEFIAHILPKKPYVQLPDGKEVKDFYVKCTESPEDIVRYKDLYKNLRNTKYYDADHIVVEISGEDIKNVLTRHRVKL